jgi:ribosome-associated protein
MTEKPVSTGDILTEIISAMREKKGFDIVVMDLRHLNNVATSYFVICSGNSDRQTQAIADYIIDQLKKELHERPLRTEGYRSGQWILIDYFDVVVHVFLPRHREYFNLEELWGDADFTRIENE